eukprot:snap_masked-scaffold_4-processed-gene-20.11-mRNA-1 protein AED:1.00 eAED:1.00 QI:0/0/0/0/1/1/3/0/69
MNYLSPLPTPSVIGFSSQYHLGIFFSVQAKVIKFTQLLRSPIALGLDFASLHQFPGDFGICNSFTCVQY